jgi:Na+-transporting NADH:ubiquinone oxidoreductase subunit A
MALLALGAGLIPDIPSPAEVSEIQDVITEEAAVLPPLERAMHVTILVKEGESVATGQAVACLKNAPDICFVAPMAGRVARISRTQGRKLSEIVLFREAEDNAVRHDVKTADTTRGLRRVLQGAGAWQWLRRRPFGGMPAFDERPAAILVMAADTRPLALDPRQAIKGREDDFSRGLAALERLTEGPVLVCQQAGKDQIKHGSGMGRIQAVTCGGRHPQGSAGIRIHQVFPAGLDTPVWDVHAEDVTAIGVLLQRGELPMKRFVRIAGPALREARTVRTHPGADLRQLTQRIVAPGPHVVMSGSPLDGHPAHWLAPRHRQITVLPREDSNSRPHWLVAALTRSAFAKPAIPTAALTQSFGGAVPALPFVRALSAGDDEAAIKLGILSLLEEDVALAEYVLSGTGQIKDQLRGMLDRIQTEFAA